MCTGLLMGAALGAVACTAPTSSDPAQPTPTVQPAQPPDDPAGTPQVVQVPIDQDGASLSYAPGRSRKRLDVDQLKATLYDVLGNVHWTRTDSSGRQFDRFDELSLTLGKPDYLESTYEDLSPSLIFQKFMGDAANQVCRKRIDHELALLSGSSAGVISDASTQPVLMVKAGPEDTIATAPERIDANLSLLLLRFHGRDLPTDSAELIAWRDLFSQAASEAHDSPSAWRAVCVALLSHPDFYSN